MGCPIQPPEEEVALVTTSRYIYELFQLTGKMISLDPPQAWPNRAGFSSHGVVGVRRNEVHAQVPTVGRAGPEPSPFGSRWDFLCAPH